MNAAGLEGDGQSNTIKKWQKKIKRIKMINKIDPYLNKIVEKLLEDRQYLQTLSPEEIRHYSTKDTGVAIHRGGHQETFS